MSRKAAATNKARNASQEHKDALVMREQLKLYALAVAEAKANNAPRPSITSFVTFTR